MWDVCEEENFLILMFPESDGDALAGFPLPVALPLLSLNFQDLGCSHAQFLEGPIKM